MGRREDRMLKAFTGLEGGIVASGSTCGVVTGGALGLALMYDDMLQERGVAAEAGVLSLTGEYLRWFEQNFGSPFCRDRSGVDFYTTWGQIRYFLPGDRVGKCLWHIRGAIRHLYNYQEKDLPTPEEPKERQDEPIHCAQAVLRGIRDRTGIGDPLLERLSFVFDGGVGYQGGVCGALSPFLNCQHQNRERSKQVFMRLFSTQFGLLIYGLPLTGASEPGISVQLFPLRSLQPGPYVSAPGSHNQ